VSAEHVEIVREGFEALERDGVEGLIPYIHPDFEGVVPPELSAEPDSYRGHEGVRRYFASFEEAVDDLRFSALEILDGGDYVVILLKVEGRGRGSGVPVDMAAVNRVYLQDGQIVHMSAHPTLEDALAPPHLRIDPAIRHPNSPGTPP
jgi:ketosteroid isomerase-like protein